MALVVAQIEAIADWAGPTAGQVVRERICPKQARPRSPLTRHGQGDGSFRKGDRLAGASGELPAKGRVQWSAPQREIFCCLRGYGEAKLDLIAGAGGGEIPHGLRQLQ